MNEKGWGLTSLGFRRPTYVELLDALEYKARELFGSTANLTVRSPLGLFLRIFAWMLNILFSILEDVYNSRFVDTAVGTSLLNLGRAIGLLVLPAQKATGYLTVTGPPGTLIPAGWLAETAAGIQFYAVTDTEIRADGTALIPAMAVEKGPTGNVEAGTVTTITNPGAVAGLEAVTNLKPFTGGRERETDEEYRDRYYISVDYAGGVNADAIRAALLQEVEGIMEAKVFENDTDFEDEHNLPPHSIEAIVYGGLESDIAKVIYDKLGTGIQTKGDIVVPIITLSGNTKNIRFNRPHPVPIYVQITNLSTGSNFPRDGRDRLIAAVVQYIGSRESGGVGVGETLYHQKLPAVLYSVPGVLDFDIFLGTDPDNLQMENIRVDSRSKVVTDEGMVSIVE